MNKKAKITITSISIFLFSFLFFSLAYVGYKKQNIQLNDYDKTESIITDKGLDYRYGSKGQRSECFYILLEGRDKKLGVYRMSRDYQDLLEKFNVGDTVTVYFDDNSNTVENINIDLIQAEKNGQVLLSKNEYERKESALIYIGLIGGIVMILLSYFYYRKTGYPKRR